LLPAATPACAQKGPDSTTPATPAQGSPAKAPSIAGPIQIAPAKAARAEPAKAADSAVPPPDRAQAYYHLALASNYEEEAFAEGHPEYVTRAIEEYKLALNADPLRRS
jgi:hypothetical protein